MATSREPKKSPSIQKYLTLEGLIDAARLEGDEREVRRLTPLVKRAKARWITASRRVHARNLERSEPSRLSGDVGADSVGRNGPHVCVVAGSSPVASTAAFAHFEHDHAERREGGVDQQTAELVGAYVTAID